MRDRRSRGPDADLTARREAAGSAGRGSRNNTCSTRMDQDRYYPLGLSIKPSELWRQQGYSTYQHEPSVA
jgi:hypothetical protein